MTEARPLLDTAGGASRDVKEDLGAVPISVNGLALGFCGLGVTWHIASAALHVNPLLRLLSTVIVLVCFTVGTFLVLLFTAKVQGSPHDVPVASSLPAIVPYFPNPQILFAREVFMLELNTPAGNALLPTYDMTLMSIAWALMQQGLDIPAKLLWITAAMIHTLFLIFFLRQLPTTPLTDYNASYLIPPVGICLAAGTGCVIGFDWVAPIFFWIGLIFFVVFFPLILYRTHMVDPPLDGDVEATYVIFAAPAALLLTSFLGTPDPRDYIVQTLFVVECITIVLVACRLPKLATLSFGPQMAAFTFPSAITARSVILYHSTYLPGDSTTEILSWLFLAISTIVVGAVGLNYLFWAAKSR